MRSIILLALSATLILAQRHVVLSWVAPASAEQLTYDVYRGGGACVSNPVFGKIVGSVGATTYDDANIPLGTYAYVVRTISSSGESGPSNCADAVVAGPAGLTAVSPSAAVVKPGGTQQFSAMANYPISWSISPSIGSISSSGLYAAPTMIQGTKKIVVVATVGSQSSLANVTVKR